MGAATLGQEAVITQERRGDFLPWDMSQVRFSTGGRFPMCNQRSAPLNDQFVNLHRLVGRKM